MTRISLNHCNRAPAFNRVRDLVAEGYVGKVLSCTMIITTPAWGTEFTLDWAYMADRSNGNTLLTSPGGHSIDALCFCLGEFKELSSVVANQRQRVKIVETGETGCVRRIGHFLLSGGEFDRLYTSCVSVVKGT